MTIKELIEKLKMFQDNDIVYGNLTIEERFPVCEIEMTLKYE